MQPLCCSAFAENHFVYLVFSSPGGGGAAGSGGGKGGESNEFSILLNKLRELQKLKSFLGKRIMKYNNKTQFKFLKRKVTKKDLSYGIRIVVHFI